jgi:UDP-N-acetylmuramoyl-tripeptide--D-alanyl-D-alanine ligase
VSQKGILSFCYMTLEELHNAFLQSEGICTDTRQEVKGTLFFALKGERFDGNRYVMEALKGGCRLAVTEREELRGEQGVLYTESSLELMQELAAFHRIYVSPEVLAITGSNGKTTTKELVSAILSKRFHVLATRGNLNNHIGVPLTLLSLKDEKVAVIEMGANHAGEIGTLAGIAAPDLGLITNVGKAHLEGFGSVAGVLEAKGELYEYLALKGGRAIVDGEDQVLLEKASGTGVETLVIGADGELPVTGRILGQSPFLEIELVIQGITHRVDTRLVGAYNIQNIRQSAAVGVQFGIPGEEIAEAIASYSPENHRSQFVEGKGNRVTLDSYNANPTSMREAISGLTDYTSSPSMVILGDMAELGEVSLEEHRELIRWIGTLPLDRILVVGPLFSKVSEPSGGLFVFKNIQELEAHLVTDPPEGFSILVKGSRVMELERLMPYLI